MSTIKLPKPSALLAEVNYAVPYSILEHENDIFDSINKVWLSYKHHIASKTIKNRRIWYLSSYGLCATANGKAVRCNGCDFTMELLPQVTDEFCVKMHLKQTQCRYIRNHVPSNRILSVKIQAYFASLQKINELLYPVAVYKKIPNDATGKFKLQAQFVEFDVNRETPIPAYPDFEDFEHRVYSFFYCHAIPTGCIELMITAARAGFVCADRENCMFCYHCSYKMVLTDYYDDRKKWMADDDALKIEHLTNSENCRYIVNALNGESDYENVDTSSEVATTSYSTYSPRKFVGQQSETEKLSERLARSLVFDSEEHEQETVNSNNKFICQKCYKGTIKFLCFPCYHASLCAECSNDHDECYICEQAIEEMTQIRLI